MPDSRVEASWHAGGRRTARALALVCGLFAVAGCFQASESEPRVTAAAETPVPQRDEVADLAATGAPSGIGILSKAAVGHPDPMVRREAIVGLTEHGAAGVPILASALRDPDPRVRIEAIESLAEIGDAHAEAALQGALRDPDVSVRQAAEDALEDLR